MIRQFSQILLFLWASILHSQTTTVTGWLRDCDGKILKSGVTSVKCTFAVPDGKAREIRVETRPASINQPKKGMYSCTVNYPSPVPVVIEATYQSSDLYFVKTPPLNATSYDPRISYDIQFVCNKSATDFFDAVEKRVQAEVGMILKENERLGKDNANQVQQLIKNATEINNLKRVFNDSLSKLSQKLAWEPAIAVQNAITNLLEDFKKKLDQKNKIIAALVAENEILKMNVDCRCVEFTNKNQIRLALKISKGNSGQSFNRYLSLNIEVDKVVDENKPRIPVKSANNDPFKTTIYGDNNWHVLEFNSADGVFRQKSGYVISVKNAFGQIVNSSGLFIYDLKNQCSNPEITKIIQSQTEEIHLDKEIKFPDQIFFEVSTDDVLKSSESGLNDLLVFLYTTDSKIKLIGYTGDIANKEEAVKLSIDRANKIKKELVQKGISDDRIEVEGRGATNFVCPSCIKNQRVSIQVIL